MARTSEEHAFEQSQLKAGVLRDIEGLIKDLELLKVYIEQDRLFESNFPQNFVGVAVRYGKLCEMNRLAYAFKEAQQ